MMLEQLDTTQKEKEKKQQQKRNFKFLTHL